MLVDEPGRALGSPTSRPPGRSVCATVGFDPAIARAVDAGLLSSRLPRRLARALDHAA